MIQLIASVALALLSLQASPKTSPKHAQPSKVQQSSTKPFGLEWIIGGTSDQMDYIGRLLKKHGIGSMAMGSLGYSLGVDPKDTKRALKYIRADKSGRAIFATYEDFRQGKPLPASHR